MQELAVKAPNLESVHSGVMQVIHLLGEETGRVTGGEFDVEEGGARIHFILPVPTARAIIGRGGENIKALRIASGMKVHVEEIVIGQGDLAEQVVSCAGPLLGCQHVVQVVTEKISEFTTQPWFSRWAFNVHAVENTELAFRGKGKGKDSGKDKGKDKGASGSGYGGHAGSSGPDYGYSSQPSGPSSHHSRAAIIAAMGGSAPRAQDSPGGVYLDMLTSAVSSVPDALADPANKSQTVQCSCPANCVSSVMGKNGSGLREISVATGTRIALNDGDGNETDKTIIISGCVVGCVCAYLQVLSRVASVKEMIDAGVTGLDEQTKDSDPIGHF